jgi:hypothetical protein
VREMLRMDAEIVAKFKKLLAEEPGGAIRQAEKNRVRDVLRRARRSYRNSPARARGPSRVPVQASAAASRQCAGEGRVSGPGSHAGSRAVAGGVQKNAKMIEHSRPRGGGMSLDSGSTVVMKVQVRPIESLRTTASNSGPVPNGLMADTSNPSRWCL